MSISEPGTSINNNNDVQQPTDLWYDDESDMVCVEALEEFENQDKKITKINILI